MGVERRSDTQDGVGDINTGNVWFKVDLEPIRGRGMGKGWVLTEKQMMEDRGRFGCQVAIRN